jgi:alkanesulfonate monooxygenase SsuD/methylene tetrahydromethanopterin reductase-like flavin-dependent oxidoreductase (luciferase family)
MIEHPYMLARRFSTLDHLTGGRIGWNVVTGYLNSAAKGIGLARQPEYDTRYVWSRFSIVTRTPSVQPL